MFERESERVRVHSCVCGMLIPQVYNWIVVTATKSRSPTGATKHNSRGRRNIKGEKTNIIDVWTKHKF